MRERFSVKWFVRIIIPYVLWYCLMVFALVLFPEFRDVGTAPLVAIIAGPTLITLAILISVLNGIYRQDRQDRHESDFSRIMLNMIRSGSSNGS